MNFAHDFPLSHVHDLFGSGIENESLHNIGSFDIGFVHFLMTFWPELIRAVNQAEGSIGIAFNVYTLILLWKKKFASEARAYRVSITISSIHAIIMSLIVPIFASATHLFHHDKFIIVMYGAAASSPWFFQQLSIFYSFFCAYTIWEMVPASSILQYLSVTRSNLSVPRRLLSAYGICVITMGWTIQHCFYFYQSADFDQIVIAVHNVSSSENFIAFGGLFHSTEDHPKSVLRLALEGIMPTYFVSYVVFGTCIVKIHKALNVGVRLSQKTLRMQRKFFIMMMLQTLLPLVIFAFPLSLFVYSMVIGSALDLYTIAISVSVWSIPSVQAIVQLSFVVNANGNAVSKEVASTSHLQSTITFFQTNVKNSSSTIRI